MKKMILTIAIALTLSITLQSTADTEPDIEIWECTKGAFGKKVLVEALGSENGERIANILKTAELPSSERVAELAETGGGIGIITISGTTEAAVFQVTESARYWGFGEDFKSAAFFINSDGSGKHIDYKTGKTTKKYRCKHLYNL